MLRCLLVVAGILGIALGACPRVVTKTDFDYKKYAGDWFEIQRIDAIFQSKLKCVRARYLETAPGVVSVYNTATSPSGVFTAITGSARAPNASAPGDLVVQFPNQQPGNYWVLDTDYTTFSAVYSCASSGTTQVEFGWLLSRSKTLSEQAITAAMQNFVKFGINTALFEKFDQGPNCVYDEVLTTTQKPTTASSNSLTIVISLPILIFFWISRM